MSPSAQIQQWIRYQLQFSVLLSSWAALPSEGATAIVSASPVTYSLPAACGRVTVLRRVTLCHAARDISAVTSVAAVIS